MLGGRKKTRKTHGVSLDYHVGYMLNLNPLPPLIWVNMGSLPPHVSSCLHQCSSFLFHSRGWGSPVPTNRLEWPDSGAGQRVTADQARGGGRQWLLPVQGQQRCGRRRQQVHVPHSEK